MERPSSVPERKTPRAPRKPTRESLLASAPWVPPDYEIADVSAIQALVAGTATKEQQRRALDWVINQAAGTYDLSFRPGDEGRRDTDFAEGRRFVGLQLVKLLKLNTAALPRKELRADPHEPKE